MLQMKTECQNFKACQMVDLPKVRIHHISEMTVQIMTVAKVKFFTGLYQIQFIL